jgi:transposase
MPAFREPPLQREQALLIPYRLEDAVPKDHSVRYLDAIMESKQVQEVLNEWRHEYAEGTGRPAVHPRRLAALYFYGQLNKVRSSRDLENACRTRIDFMWLMSMEKPDHSTIAAFVTKHEARLDQLFKAVIKICISAGLVGQELLLVDGTLIWANASRASAKNADRLREQEARIEQYVEALRKEWQANEERAVQPSLLGEMPTEDTPQSIKRAEQKLRRIRKALGTAERRAEQSIKGKTQPVASTTDPDSRNCKDKAGRTRPCYNGQVGVDSAHGVIVANELSDAAGDQGKLPVVLDESRKNTGADHHAVAADGAYADGSALNEAEGRGITTYIPASDPLSAKEQEALESLEAHRAKGESPTTEEVKSLPKDKDGRFKRAFFQYDSETDTYLCPVGRRMTKLFDERVRTSAGQVRRRRYSCRAAKTCPFAAMCCGKKSEGRVVIRDEFEGCRERLRERMKTPEAREIYAQRSALAERPFGQMKGNWGIRQLLRRGLANVTAEWSILLTSINITILLKHFDRVSKVL